MKLYDQPVILTAEGPKALAEASSLKEGREKTLAYRILRSHDKSTEPGMMRITFDSLTSHDITYVGILQTARASGMKEFPMPYVLTNCHNSLCAVGGTINEDDHRFALSAARKYGGIYVPPCFAVIHSYNREMMTGAGRMILGSDSHTRYGALGTMGIGEGGGELAKQLVGRTYDLADPEVVLVWLKGKPRPGIGPHDAALALVGAVYEKGFVKNRILEFAGPGIQHLSQDYRNGIDVMTTETGCLSSIWETDDTTKEYYEIHKRPADYKKLSVTEGAAYDRMIEIDLSSLESMIALPMHPSYAMPIRVLKEDPYTILKEAEDRSNHQLGGRVKMDLVSLIKEDGKIHTDQAVIAGCSGGTYENLAQAAAILKGSDTGNRSFRLSVYPDSMPTYKALMQNGILEELIDSGAVIREAFCGPCFGAGDTPANGEFSIRHSTRNFPNREGSKPGEGQIAAVALMDARSIAATAANHGILTGADELNLPDTAIEPCGFDDSIYRKRVYNGWQNPHPEEPLIYGPNIKDWPEQPQLTKDLLIKVASYITDPVTTTDELIPSGETSSFRSNPLRLARFTLSRKDPAYTPQADQIREMEEGRISGTIPAELETVYTMIRKAGLSEDPEQAHIGSAIYAHMPGDGSAREQAASCQRVLGGAANIARQYATKRYRTNCINWGILPFTTTESEKIRNGDFIFLPGIREAVAEGMKPKGYIIRPEGEVTPLDLDLGSLSDEEREILLQGCLINHYRH